VLAWDKIVCRQNWDASLCGGSSRTLTSSYTKESIMLWTIVVILIVLWLLGMATNVAGGLIHVLLVLALIVIAVNFLQGRRTV
jgi:hypothetical protein